MLQMVLMLIVFKKLQLDKLAKSWSLKMEGGYPESVSGGGHQLGMLTVA